MKTHITRKLRREQTPWEIKVWNVLQNRQIAGLKFRRQLKIGDSIVDFCCLEKKLIVELDGGHHNETEQAELDKSRQQQLESKGYRILRFWNNEVEGNLEGVVETIIQCSQPHPNPLPDGRG